MPPERLEEAKKWRKLSRVFVNSMSELFHERMPLHFLKRDLLGNEGVPPVHLPNSDSTKLERVPCLTRQLDPDRLHVGVLVKNLKTVLPAEAAHLVATEGRVERNGSVGV